MFEIRKKAELIPAAGNKVIAIKKNKIEIGLIDKIIGDDNILLFKSNNGEKINVRSNIFTKNISQKHCQLIWVKEKKRYKLVDFSRNGSWVNKSKIHRGEKILQHEDKIGLGTKHELFTIIYQRRYLGF